MTYSYPNLIKMPSNFLQFHSKQSNALTVFYPKLLKRDIVDTLRKTHTYFLFTEGGKLSRAGIVYKPSLARFVKGACQRCVLRKQRASVHQGRAGGGASGV